jgi:hypothetical protein
MRVAVVLVAAVVVAMPVPAAPVSASCMSLGEARHQFGSVHLYWHGSSHCWDASPGRHRYTAKAERHTGGQKHREAERPKWREARSELVADNEPTRVSRETADQRVATPDTPPIRMLPVRVTPIKLASFVSDWSERWVDVEQTIPDRLIKAQSSFLTTPALEQNVDATLVVRGLALFTFGFGLVLTFAALLMRSGKSAIGPPVDDAHYASRGFATGQADEGSHMLRTDRDDAEGRPQSSTALLPAIVILGSRWLGIASHLVVVLILRQANFLCWRALRWGRRIDSFSSHGAYPMDVKWPAHSAGAMISRDDISRPFTVPSKLLEEARQAALPATRTPTPQTRTS